MKDYSEYPKIVLSPEDTTYWGWYEYGRKLEEAFPKSCGGDFSSALNYNEDQVPADLLEAIKGDGISELKCVYEGERDEENWEWVVTISRENEYPKYKRYYITGWCDYTGWDCRSGIDVKELP